MTNQQLVSALKGTIGKYSLAQLNKDAKNLGITLTGDISEEDASRILALYSKPESPSGGLARHGEVGGVIQGSVGSLAEYATACRDGLIAQREEFSKKAATFAAQEITPAALRQSFLHHLALEVEKIQSEEYTDGFSLEDCFDVDITDSTRRLNGY